MKSKLNFSTKAKTLLNLSKVVNSASVATIDYFSVLQWKQKKEKCLKSLFSVLGDGPYIVRSSCQNEDSLAQSNAGAFASVLNVNKQNLESAIENVISSYGEACDEDEVLVQPMLEDVNFSGVAFSHDPNTCSPYRIINWSMGSDTSSVTGGKQGEIWQQAAYGCTSTPPKIKQVIRLLEELLDFFDGQPIDCEFASTGEDKKEQLWLLQVRPLIIATKTETNEAQFESLKLIEQKIKQGLKSHPFLMGKRTVWGIMPDWNPAEIIGVRPKPLALSLYRDLITDSIWAYQRHNYGYRNLRSFPLMPHFFGLPYIDVRVSFNSFVPADLEEKLANRLVDYYIDRLLSKPNLHDKVEFEIVFSCYTLDLKDRLQKLDQANFSKTEIDHLSDSLRRLTNRIVDNKHGLWLKDQERLKTLKERRDILLHSNSDPVERVYWLIEDCKRYGTLPFAGLARAGFVAVQMLNSLVTVGAITEVEKDLFMASLSTISGQMTRDRSALDKTTFLNHYGHLRPGTYEITSPRYDEDPDSYFDWAAPTPSLDKDLSFALTIDQLRKIEGLLKVHGLEMDTFGLFDFMQSAIEARESAKFHFTRNLSDALSLISEIGENLDIDKEDLSFCDVNVFQEMYVSSNDPKEMLLRSIENGKSLHDHTCKLSLPPLIASPDELWGFQWPEASPNFITQKEVIAEVSDISKKNELSGKIVCIPNADPGFDWLFSRSISGLVTTWGGANSHMAIRAGELSLPAAIGVGETTFKEVSKGDRVHLDCKGKRIEVLS